MWNQHRRINRLQATIITLLAVIVAIFTASSIKETTPRQEHTMRPQDFAVVLPTSTPPTPTPNPASNRIINYYENWFKPYYLDKVRLYHYELELTSLGYYYITSYCPAECGYNGSNYPTGWMTASGAVCHRASYEDRYDDPTTCAISRSIHSFGDLFYIKEFDRVFIGEDTGSAVRGRHLDLFYEDMESVRSFPTGNYETFSVEYVYVSTDAGFYRKLRNASEKGYIRK